MKVMRKISAVVLCLCLLVPCFSMVALAADGRISFSDPETKVGDEFDVKCAARSSGGNMGSIEIKITYDSAFLRFVSGDGVTQDEEGALTLSADGGSAEQIFMVKFQALQEGSTQVNISGATIVDANGAELTMDQGSSSVTIGEGDPSKIQDIGPASPAAEDMQVDVNGVAYTLTDKFSDGDIPSGYERITVNLDGQDRQMVANASSGVTLGYLIGADSTASFFVFNQENATFSPYAEIVISDMSSIVLMSDPSKASLPADYKEATLTLGDHEFPVWQNENDSGFYVLYATNNNGETGCYRYDPSENTYQRITPDDGEDASAIDTSTLLGKIQQFITDNIQKIVLFGGLGVLLFLLIFLVLIVKLHNRNVELDELYEEYGLNDMDELPPPPKKEKKQKKQSKPTGRKKPRDDYEDDDFATDDLDFATDEMDFATDEMDFETEDIDFEAEELDFSTSDFGFKTEGASPTEEMDFETSGLDLEGVEEDNKVVYGGKSRTGELTIDDLDKLLSEEKKPAKKEQAFQVDFIDLD